jgi:hypothetical protein
MNENQHNDQQSDPKEASKMSIWHAVLLTMLSPLITVSVAYALSPNHHISPLGYVVWIVGSLVLHAGLIMQNTVEGCFIVGMILALPIGVIIFKGRILPAHIMWPGLCAVMIPWILTRIHRRYADNRPWVE